MNWRLFFRSVRPLLWYLLAFAAVEVLAINLFLNDIPEIFDKGSELGVMIEKLCYAYIGSFIFYLLVVHYKSFTDKSKVNGFIEARVRNVIGCSSGMLHDMAPAAHVELSSTFPNSEELHLICAALHPYGPSKVLSSPNVNGPYLTWLQFLLYQKQRSDHFSKDVLDLMPYLDAELVRQITSINNCSFFKSIENINRVQINNQDLTCIEGDFIRYIEMMAQLSRYHQQKLSPYQT